MPDRKRIAEYFLVVGLPPENPQPLEINRMEEYDEEEHANGSLHPDPVTDIAVVNANESELPPRGFTVIKTTPSGFPADLNGESFNAPAMYLCLKRGRDKPPLTEIGVFYHPKESCPPPGHEVLRKTPYGRAANVSNTSSLEVYLTYRRAATTAAANCPVVTDACVIIGNKDEDPPHAFIKVDKNLNKGLLSSPVFVCYKSSRVRHHQLTYTAAILSRYPAANHPECPLSESVPLFGLPTGAVLEAWPARSDLPQPECSPFVLTDAEGVKLYGSSLSFYEVFDRALLSEEQCRALELDLEAHRRLDLRVFSNKAIVIISMFPFFDAFKSFLQFLHSRIHWSAETEPSTGALAVPLERYVLHFLHELHCPSPHVPNIELSLHDSTITLRMIEDTMNISQGGASFLYLLSDLGADNAISVLMYTLTEQKLLVHSLRQDRLTRVCEAIISIIFPLQWQCAYIPLCPLELSGLLHAPVPFIYGFDSRYFDFNRRPPDDVICVDLDAHLLQVPAERKYSALKLLPKKPLRVLKTSLEERLVRIREFEQRHARTKAGSLDVAMSRLENEIETSIKECFLRFMACLLRDYRGFLVPIKPNSSQYSATDSFSLFNIEGFQRSKDRAYHKFYSQLLHTQMFSRFIEENSLGSPGRDEMLAFFEECTLTVDETRDAPPLLERDKTLASEHTKLVLPPEPLDPNKVYTYNGVFPCLDEDLIRQLEPTDSLFYSETSCDADSGIAGTGSTASAVAPVAGPRESSGAGLDDSALPTPQHPAVSSAEAAGLGTPRIAHRTPASGEPGVNAPASGQKPAWLRIKHEQMVTNKIGKVMLQSKARDKVWPCHLLSAAYCLWFPIVPAYINFRLSRRDAYFPLPTDAQQEAEALLRSVLDLVNRMLQLRVVPIDQVCYRILLHMAALHRLPQLAMDVLVCMQNGGVQPNAVTYALYNQVLLELGVVSDSIDKSEMERVGRGPAEDSGSLRSAMKRSLSDDGQLDGRPPRVTSPSSRDDGSLATADQRRPRGLSTDATAGEPGYGTLREVGASVDTAVTELKDFMKEQSSRAMHYQKVVRARLARSIWTMVTPKTKSKDSSRKEAQQAESAGEKEPDARSESPCEAANAGPPPPAESAKAESPPLSEATNAGPLPACEEADAGPPPPCEAINSKSPPSCEDPPPAASSEVPTDGAATPPDPEAADLPKEGDVQSAPAPSSGSTSRTESPKTLPIIRRPKRPSIIRNRSLTADDRRRVAPASTDRARDDSADAGLLHSMTPTPAGDAVFELAPDAGPVAESTPLSVEVEAEAERPDPDRTPMPSSSGQEPATPTPQAPNPPALRKPPVRNLQSLFVEKSELHISFLSNQERAKAAGQAARRAGSTFSVDSRLSTETEEDGEEGLEEEATSTEDEEDFSGLATFFQLARRAGLTSRLTRPAPVPARSSTQSLPQGEPDTTSVTSRGSADNALSAVSNFKRHASTRLKDAASRFSQKMASMRQQWNPALPTAGAGATPPNPPGGLNRSTGELRSNSFVAGPAAAPAAAPGAANWLSVSMRRLRASQDSSLGGGAGSMGEDSDEEDSDSSATPCTLRDVWKHISGISVTSPVSSQPSSHRPSVGSTPTSPVEETAPGQRRGPSPPMLLLRLSSCSACVQCRALIYDEDIMNGWTHEASNLNTICPYCQNPTLPRLTISLVVETAEGRRGVEEHMTTLYLSPLALRKVMETVFVAESSDCLQQVGVIDAHPELFWNYVWYLTRLQLPNHLLHLVGLWWSSRHGRAQPCRLRVELKCDAWTVLPDEAGLKPLYRVWIEKSGCDESDPMSPVVKHMKGILEGIKSTDMNEALRRFLEERHVKVTDRSAYREILHLSLQALGRSNINMESFVHFYQEAYRHALERNERLEPYDKPPERGVIWCRTLFPVLDL